MTDDTPQFQGFTEPTENWSKLPHAFIDLLPQFTSQGEMAVVLYILRHTWGYGDESKRISLDEFMYGRKRKDGTRIDNGVGMSKPSIIQGIKRAIEHGFITVETDETDKARIEKSYSIKRLEVKNLDSSSKETLHPMSNNFTPNIERNLSKKKTPPTPHAGERSALFIVIAKELFNAKEGVKAERTVKRIEKLEKLIISMEVDVTKFNAFVAWYRRDKPNLSLPCNPDTVEKNLNQFLSAKPVSKWKEA